MSLNRADALKKIGLAKANANGNPIKMGANYDLRIRNLLLEAKFGGTMFIGEFTVASADVYDAEQKPNAVGSSCSIAINLEDQYGMGAMNVKSFILALLGAEEIKQEDDPAGWAKQTEEVQQAVATLTGKDQPGRGLVIRCEPYQRPSKGRGKTPAGTMMTFYRWFHVEQTAEEVAAGAQAENAKPAA